MVAHTMWETCAIPGILYATDCLPLTQSTIAELDRIQSSVAKFILQIHPSSSNIGADIEVGFMPMRYRIIKKVIKYYTKLRDLSDASLVKQTFNENIFGSWNSKYAKNLINIFTELGILGHPDHPAFSSGLHFNHEAIKYMKKEWMKCAKSLGALPLPVNGWFKKQDHINDSIASKILCEFRSGNAKLGNRMPIDGGIRIKLCPFCSTNEEYVLVNESHIVTQCRQLKGVRQNLNINKLLKEWCVQKISPIHQLRLLLGSDGSEPEILFERALDLALIRDAWIQELKVYWRHQRII